MTQNTQPISPLRQRMIDDMTLRKLSPQTQAAYVRADNFYWGKVFAVVFIRYLGQVLPACCLLCLLVENANNRHVWKDEPSGVWVGIG